MELSPRLSIRFHRKLRRTICCESFSHRLVTERMTLRIPVHIRYDVIQMVGSMRTLTSIACKLENGPRVVGMLGRAVMASISDSFILDLVDLAIAHENKYRIVLKELH